MMNAKAISDRSRGREGCGSCALAAFGLIFFLVGCGIFWGLFLYPWIKSREARSWPAHPCHIESSEVESHHDDDGTSYAPKIRYRYSLDGKDLFSERYTFTSMSSGRKWAERIVARFPAGTDSVCYYDPADPTMVVLERGFGGFQFWFGLLLPWVFIFVGAGTLFFGVLRAKFRGRSGAISAGQSIRPAAQATGAAASPLDGNDDDASSEVELADDFATEFAEFDGPRKLKQETSRIVATVGIGLFALFWNGFVSVFLYAMIFGRPGNWFMWLFLTPFVLVGLLLLLIMVHQVLSLANPAVEIALSNGAVGLGESIDVAWELTGRVGRIRHLTITVEGTEKATYTRGTSTVTEKHLFRALELISTDDPNEFAFGTRTLTLPADTMHSWSSRHNAILWTIHVVGSIPWWPDINDSFEFKVKPSSPAVATDEDLA